MATLKNPPSIMQTLENQVKGIKAHYKAIKRRWYVGELTPATIDNEYGTWISEKRVRASNYFDTKDEAEKFIDKHDPAKGTTFYINVETLCEHVEQTWMPGDNWS